MDDRQSDRLRSSRDHIRSGSEMVLNTRRTIEITRAIIARSAPLHAACTLCGGRLRIADDIPHRDGVLTHAACEEGLSRSRRSASEGAG